MFGQFVKKISPFQGSALPTYFFIGLYPMLLLMVFHTSLRKNRIIKKMK